MMEYPIELVLGAACYAQRQNGEYVKYAWPADAPAKPTNRSLMMDALAPGANLISEEDMELGRQVRRHYQGLTFKILKNEPLGEFEKAALAIVDQEQVSSNYHLAVICSFPSCHAREVSRAAVKDRVAFARGGYVGRVGDKVTLEVEILKQIYSQQWATYYATAITVDDQAIFFSFKNALTVGAKMKIKGTVKSHKENQTQLNRVKEVV